MHRIFFFLFSLTSAGWVGAETQPPSRANQLIRLVRQDCGSCHGMTLKGGLGPALLPETLAEKPAEALKLTILYGRPGTPMPGWSHFLAETEVDWIVAKLQTNFPME
jgi:cytochrome c55X